MQLDSKHRKTHHFDFVVIGSGFGGSVATCRLAESGHRVALLERGQRYPLHSFPRRIHEIQDRLFWDPKDQKFGYMEVKNHPDSDIMSVTASGLGGGSLIYANVLLPMTNEYFWGWPEPFNFKLLEPYYKRVLQFMEATPYPLATDPYYAETAKTKLFQKVSQSLSRPQDAIRDPEFLLPHLAVQFQGSNPGEQFFNQHGARQAKCTKCGECDIGCNYHAKNTLDLNYIFRAEHLSHNPAHIITSAQVTEIIPHMDQGYKIIYHNPQQLHEPQSIYANKVILAAGSLGSTQLLLQQKQRGNLPALSDALGTRWSGNGDLLGLVKNSQALVDASNGPVITSAIKFDFKPYPDGHPSCLYLEDAGIPIGLCWYLAAKQLPKKNMLQSLYLGLQLIINKVSNSLGLASPFQESNLGDKLSMALDSDHKLNRVMILLAMGKDRADGVMTLREDGELIIQWNLQKSQLHFERIKQQLDCVAKELQGQLLHNPLTLLDKYISVHPLGGCPMGDNSQEAVVNTCGEVFGHKGLFVMDGSIIPTSIGPNPALTIAALTEYLVEQL